MATKEPEARGRGAKTERVRLAFDTTERLRRAVRMRAHLRSAEVGAEVTIQDVCNEALEAAFASELAEVDRLDGKPPPRKGK